MSLEAFKRRELIFGLIAPIGTNLSGFIKSLDESLQQFSYVTEKIKVTDFLQEKYAGRFSAIQDHTAEDLELKIELGNQARSDYGSPEILAKYAAAKIGALKKEKKSQTKVAFVVSQIKRMEEVSYLRSVYGDAFFLIGVHSPEEVRANHLMQQYKCGERERITKLMELDEDEKNFHRIRKTKSEIDFEKYGQAVGDTFCKADFFVKDMNSTPEILRFLDLVFGSPNVSPSRSEHLMYLAFSTSARSADLSRQVGAVLADSNGNVLGIGANDVPKFGGGQYEPTTSDQRDFARGFDSNSRKLDQICESLLEGIGQIVEIKDDNRNKLWKYLRKQSELKNITEFMRPVHAEVEAILQCSRVGNSPAGTILYSTTFPCHNCAKHLVGAGITEVVYVEPYAKSLAEELHVDAIKLVDDETKLTNKVAFRPFLGIGPRRFLDLFSSSLTNGEFEEKKSGTVVRPFIRSKVTMRFPTVDASTDKLEELAKVDISASPQKERAA